MYTQLCAYVLTSNYFWLQNNTNNYTFLAKLELNI
jgi:hypothetical protein